MSAKPLVSKTDTIRNVFPIGRKIDLAFNLDSLRPTVRSTIIHECDYMNRIITLSQTNPKILSNLDYRKMEVTTLVGKQTANRIRVGINCEVIRYLNDYRLSDGNPHSETACRLLHISVRILYNCFSFP